MSLESPSEEFAPIPDQRKSPSNASSEKRKVSATPISPASEDDASEPDLDISHPAAWNFSMNIPQTSFRTSVEVPAEEIGGGVNRQVFFVCSSLHSGDWTELPSATPHQINVARRIRKYLMGNLDAVVSSCPTFPGTERHYLRAIIARISASTHVAPQNFYELGRALDDESRGSLSEEEEDLDCSKFAQTKFLSHQIPSDDSLWCCKLFFTTSFDTLLFLCYL
jgi:hypothetical protein